jgi:antitoxin component YwqK of YwqJK toxin-antitoxin module
MRSLVSLVGLLFIGPAFSQEFACGSRHCAIPYDDQGVQQGVEVCWDSAEKKEKVRELTWSKGKRNGEARCWEKGKLVTIAQFKDNRLQGLFVDQRYSQIEVHRFDQGKLSGYRLHLEKDNKSLRLGPCYRDGEVADNGENFCRQLDYGAYKPQLEAYFAKLKGEEKVKLAKLNGAQLDRYSDGKVKAKYNTRGGELVGAYEAFWPNGKIRLKGQYSDGKREGEFLSYHEDGYLTGRDVYRLDKPVKLETVLQNGKLSERTEWITQDGRARVCRETFHENGVAAYRSCRKGWYSDYDGEYVWWNEQGKPVFKGQYLDNQRVGTWSSYDRESLALAGESKYENGKLLAEWYINDKNQRVDRTFFPDGSLKTETIK